MSLIQSYTNHLWLPLGSNSVKVTKSDSVIQIHKCIEQCIFRATVKPCNEIHCFTSVHRQRKHLQINWQINIVIEKKLKIKIKMENEIFAVVTKQKSFLVVSKKLDSKSNNWTVFKSVIFPEHIAIGQFRLL